MLTHQFSKKALSSLKGHSASMKCAKLYNFKISTFSTILDWKLQWFGWEKYCADHKSGVFTPFQCEFLQNISDLIIFNIKWPNMGVSFKNYAKIKFEICAQKKAGNMPNLIISSQDGQVARCDLSFLGAADAWNQTSQSHDSLPILPFQICGSTGRPTMALALLWGTVGPGEGGGEVLVCSSSVEEQAETVPCLNSLWNPTWDPEISWPSLPHNLVLTGPPISWSYVTFLTSYWPYFTSWIS